MNKKKSNKSKIKIFNGALFTITGGAALYKGVGSILKYKSSKTASKKDKTGENKVGYDNINVVNNTSVHTNNFIILHVNKENNIALLREKLEFCEQHNISIGLVLDTEANNLGDIYKDIDFLQAVVKEYKIDLPVYCNINNIMNNAKLNNAERQEIIKAFIDKMSKSDMYFGLHGTDTNLCDCNEYILDTTKYDCYLVQDKNNIEYDGTCNIKKDLNGQLKADLNLSKIIIKKEFNSSNKLVFSTTYKVKENDTYHSLALKYGLSEEDLRSYNNNDKNELTEGKMIYIPNLYKSVNTKTNTVDYNYAIARGIDISDYQEIINWDRVAETSEFVIVQVARDKVNDTNYEDSYKPACIGQIKNTLEQNIELGLYFCIGKDMNVAEYEKRLDKYFSQFEQELDNNNITLNRENIPVFLDFETYYEYNDYYRLMSVFEKKCNEHGFKKIGIYGNRSTLEAISSSLEKDGKHIEIKDTNWFVWQSGGPQYSIKEHTDEGYTLDQIIEVKNESHPQFNRHIIQGTNVCKDTGAANSAGNCDVNFCYSTEVFGDVFGKKEVENEYTETILVDLNQYKGVSAKNIGNAITNTILAIGGAIISFEVIGVSLYVIISRKVKGKVKGKTK